MSVRHTFRVHRMCGSQGRGIICCWTGSGALRCDRHKFARLFENPYEEGLKAMSTIVAIDGPAASGKSTLGQMLADNLNYRYFDSGMLYRTVSALSIQHNISITDIARLKELIHMADLEFLSQITRVNQDQQGIVRYLRDPLVEKRIPLFTQCNELYEIFQQQKRHIALSGDIVVIGRDIGAVVAPEADYKVFLDASIEQRIQRRYLELHLKGFDLNQHQVAQNLRRRDEIEEPYKYLVADAIYIQTDDLSTNDLLQRILCFIG